MPAIHESPTSHQLGRLRQRPSGVAAGNRMAHSNGSQTSFSAAPPRFKTGVTKGDPVLARLVLCSRPAAEKEVKSIPLVPRELLKRCP